MSSELELMEGGLRSLKARKMYAMTKLYAVVATLEGGLAEVVIDAAEAHYQHVLTDIKGQIAAFREQVNQSPQDKTA